MLIEVKGIVANVYTGERRHYLTINDTETGGRLRLSSVQVAIGSLKEGSAVHFSATVNPAQLQAGERDGKPQYTQALEIINMKVHAVKEGTAQTTFAPIELPK